MGSEKTQGTRKAEPTGGRLSLVYGILRVNDDGTSGDGLRGDEEA